MMPKTHARTVSTSKANPPRASTTEELTTRRSGRLYSSDPLPSTVGAQARQAICERMTTNRYGQASSDVP